MSAIRTCCALHRRLTFPPDIVVLIILVVIILVVVLLSIVTSHRIRVIFRGFMAGSFFTAGRHGRGVSCCRCSVTDRCAWMMHAFRAEPFAIWDRSQRRGEACVVIGFITLTRDCQLQLTSDGEQKRAEGVPYRTQVGPRDLCGISCIPLASSIRLDDVAAQNIFRSV